MADAEATIAELTRRLERLEAVEAIQRLKYRYWRACDRKDPDGFRDCFVKEGADLSYGPGLGTFDNRESLVEAYSRLALRRENERWLYNDIHHGKHPDIDVGDDGTATGRWTFWFMRVDLDAGIVVQSSMEYDDRYVVEDDQWRIQRSYVTPLTGITFPIPQGAHIAPGPPP